MKRRRSPSSSPVVVMADPSTFSNVVQRLTGMPKPDISENKEGYNENAMKKPLLFKPVPKRPTIDQVTGKSSPWLSSLILPTFTSSHSPPLDTRYPSIMKTQPEDDLFTTIQIFSKFLEEE
ncbi:hypothetical protein SUGI_0817000 [Cryptomeria japonica]|nr:hypothetical protein SUGI_0817000 [Cryptomeria japonica]